MEVNKYQHQPTNDGERRFKSQSKTFINYDFQLKNFPTLFLALNSPSWFFFVLKTLRSWWQPIEAEKFFQENVPLYDAKKQHAGKFQLINMNAVRVASLVIDYWLIKRNISNNMNEFLQSTRPIELKINDASLIYIRKLRALYVTLKIRFRLCMIQIEIYND